MTRKSYRELSHIPSYAERFQYLKLRGKVGEETFGRARTLNQEFYHSDKWLAVRDHILLRDSGCDMGVKGYDIDKYAIVHHINPITEDEILNDSPTLYDPDNLITVSKDTHNAIHYGDPNMSRLLKTTEERHPGDTCPWK